MIIQNGDGGVIQRKVEVILDDGRDRPRRPTQKIIEKVEIMDCIRLRHADIRPGSFEPHEMAVAVPEFSQPALPDETLDLRGGRVVPVDVTDLKDDALFFRQRDHLFRFLRREGDRFFHEDVFLPIETFSADGQMVVGGCDDIHSGYSIKEIMIIA